MMGKVRGNMGFLFSMIMIMLVSGVSPVCAFSLDLSNVQGVPGAQYWDIKAPGTYTLDITADEFSTNHNYAIRIFASNVIINGNGKTITGPGIPTVIGPDPAAVPSYYGISVNSGIPSQPSTSVTVKNVTVKNKSFGVKYEYVQIGEISSSRFESNTYGIYTVKSSNLKITSNTANANEFGIVLGSENDYFTIDSNIVNSNVQFGIYLYWSNNHNVISNNQININNMGIVLTAGGTGASGSDNTISGNTVNGNVNGIYVSNYHNNRVTGNSLSGNTNVAVWLLASSSGNQFSGNFVLESGWVGMYLTGNANGNVLYNNVFNNGSASNPDSNYYSDGTDLNNQWNIAPPVPAVVNIIGGPNIGGNYWTNPFTSGFSDTHRDSNSDGFCDEPYHPRTNLTDNYPLAGDMNTVRYLDRSNVKGATGSEYWDIVAPGTWILSADVNTSNRYAVWIHSSDVIFDGNNKTITGPSIGNVETGGSYYGIRVNSGALVQNVTVKNVTVSNKHFGVIYEWVDGGEIRGSHFTANHTGIYTWKSSHLSILSNEVNANTDGIVLDANLSTNDYMTIDSNNVHHNNTNGIMLWLSNNHNAVTNNQVNNNNTGIALTDSQGAVLGGVGGTANTLSGNTVNQNANGIYVWNYYGNNINGNTLSGNTNAAVLMGGTLSTNNTIANNQVNDNVGMGIALTDGGAGANNTLANNTINRNSEGIFIKNYHGNSISGNTLSDNAPRGIWLLGQSSNNLFTGNSVVSAEEIGWYGVYLTNGAHGNVFYNNVFKNSHQFNPDENYGSDGTEYDNQWYTTLKPGPNIVGGPTIGGNYWGNLHVPPTGFSDTQPDSNNDGFCDQPYNPNAKLIDLYPLHLVSRISVTPVKLSFGSVPVGSTKNLTLRVTNTGSGTLTGNATTAVPFSVLSGGSYSLGVGQYQDVTVRYQPVSEGSHIGTVVFTGGGGATVSLTGRTSSGTPWLLLLLGN